MSDSQKEMQIQKLEISMEQINTRFDKLDLYLEKRFSEIFKRFDDLDDRYASKLVEKIVYSAIGLILVTVIGALVGLVVIK